MSWRKYLICYFHNLFGMHHFDLKPTPYGGFIAKCSCGAMLRRSPPMQVVK